MSTPTASPPDDTVVPRPDLPVLIGLAELTDLVEGQVTKQSVYRWRVTRGNAPAALPEPLVTVSGTPLWDEATILRFLSARKLTPDRKALARIRRAQRPR